jgi:hypothetical protein
MYVPHGYLLYERSMNMADVIGLRTSVIPKAIAKDLHAFLTAMKSTSKAAEEALKFLQQVK